MKVTLITGASAGIGEAFANRLAREKHNLLLVSRSEDKLQKLCGELQTQYGIMAQYIAVDLMQAGSDKIIFEETQKHSLQVNWLINNAGIGSGGDLLEYDLKSITDMMHLNMDNMVALVHRFLPQMRASKSGKIINVGSMAGFMPIPYMNVYAATKAFVKSFTEALWEENRLFNIQVMLLCPGATETNFFEAAKIGADRKSSFSTKKLETSEDVVTSAIKGLHNNNRVTISGQQNKIIHSVLRFLGPFIPQGLILKGYGNKMRKELKYN